MLRSICRARALPSFPTGRGQRAGSARRNRRAVGGSRRALPNALTGKSSRLVLHWRCGLVGALHKRHHPTVRGLVSLVPDVALDALAVRDLALPRWEAALSRMEREQLPVSLAVGASSRDAGRAVGSVLQKLLHPSAVGNLAVGVIARGAMLQHLQILSMIAPMLGVWIVLCRVVVRGGSGGCNLF